METKINKIKQLMRLKERENLKLYSFIKYKFSFGDKNLLRLVTKKTEEIWSKINCKECGNCCRELKPTFTEKDIHRISKKIGLLVEDFKNQYLTYNDSERKYELKNLPCPFLKENSCSIHEFKPEECKEFPYLHRDIRARMYGLLSNAEICPVVFNVLEELKLKYLR